MHRRLAVTLGIVVTLSGLGVGRAATAAISPPVQQARAHVSLLPSQAQPASRLADSGGGVIRTGPLLGTVSGTAVTKQVLGIGDIFLAGRTFPFTLHSHYGIDVAGRNNPAQIRLTVSAGHVVTIDTLYGTAHGPSGTRADTADGRTGTMILGGPAEPGATKVGLSSLRAPIDSLVGVFIGTKPNTGRVPATLDFRSAAARDAVTVRPALNQTFFIGRGRTSRGIKKRYIVPGGAAYLDLGSFDHLGGNHDNHGVMLAFVSGAAPAPVQYKPLPTNTRTPLPTQIPGTASPLPVTGTALPTDTVTNTPVPTNTPTNTYTPTIPPTPSNTLTPAPTNTPIPTSTASFTPSPTLTPTLSPTFPAIPTITGTSTPTATRTATPFP